MGKVRRGGNKAPVSKKKGGAGAKSSGVIKRSAGPASTSKPKKQPGKKLKVSRVAHKHHSKETLFLPENPVCLSAED